MPLQIRRGLSTDLTAGFVPQTGEPVFTTDTKKLYVGDGVSNGTQLVAINADIDLADLQDVSNVPPLDGEILRYDDATSSWEPSAFTANSLSEFSISSPNANEVLKYDDDLSSPTFGKFINDTLSTFELGDVSSTLPLNGQALVFDSTTNKYTPQTVGGGGGGATDLNGLTDVVINTPLEGHTLVYNSTTNVFENQLYARGLSTIDYVYMGGGAQIEAALGDVTLAFTNGTGIYAGIQDNSFSTGTAKQCLTADGNGGLNWEQVLLENVAGGTLQNAADDAAAATAGVPVGGIYRDGSVLKVRVS